MGKNIIIRIILFVVGMLGLIWFLIPYVGHGILNIGNGAGIIIFLLIIVYSIKMLYINNLISKVWKKLAGRIFLIAAGVFTAAVISIVLFITAGMITSADKQASENATVILLGCRVYKERPSLMLLERLKAAYTYLNENEEARCILSGGQGTGESISEAECMYRYLVNRGIDSKRLYKEENSTSTRENITYSKKIIDKYNLNPEIAIVTNEFHEYRAEKVADSLGLDSGAVSGKTAWWLLPTYYVRELFAIVYEWSF